LFEFGSHDMVKTHRADSTSTFPTAYELVQVGDARNVQKRLLFHILLHAPEPHVIFGALSEQERQSLCQKREATTFPYPAIKNWFAVHNETIQALMPE
jgi:hypothetical protein